MNMIKGWHGPIVFKVIAAFRNAQTQQELENAMRGFANLHINGLEFARTKASNLQRGNKLRRSEIEAIQHAQRTGKLLAHRTAPTSQHFRVVGDKSSNVGRHGTAWRAPQQEWRWSQFMQIAEMYDFHGEDTITQWTMKDLDGSLVFFPFSGLAKTMVTWNTWINECWWNERLQRMKRDCNRLFDTEFNADVLMFIALHCRLKALRADIERMAEEGVSTRLTNSPIDSQLTA